MHAMTSAEICPTCGTCNPKGSGFYFDYDRALFVVDGENIHLTNAELEIVDGVYSRYPGHYRFEPMIERLWPITADEPEDPNTVLSIHSLHIRKKLKDTNLCLETSPGTGLRFAYEPPMPV